MSREQSDDEDSVVGIGTDRFVDATVEKEVELRLPLELNMEPDRILKDIPIFPGAVGLDAFSPDSGAQRRPELPNGAKPKWARHGLQLPDHLETLLRRLLPSPSLPVPPPKPITTELESLLHRLLAGVPV